MQNKFSQIENTIGYIFQDKEILKKAFIHPSYANENNINRYDDNQRLEFLGDAVLEICISKYLYHKFPLLEEGALTKLRADMVCENTLSKIATNLKLYDYLVLGNGENNKKIKNNSSTMCDTIEALIGAIYIDSDIDIADRFIQKFIVNGYNSLEKNVNHKSIIQEYANKKGLTVSYTIKDETGPAHKKYFIVNLLIGNVVKSTGEGFSKKLAEQDAAKNYIIKYNIKINNVS